MIALHLIEDTNVSTMPRLSEAEFLDQVIQLARLRQWKVCHFRPARTARGWRTPCQGDGVGFPDVLLLRPRDGRMLAAELKSRRGRLSTAQQVWLDALRACGCPSFVWSPADWPEIERVLM